MAQKKAHEVDGWLSRPDDSIKIILFYGPDRGLVSGIACALRPGKNPTDGGFGLAFVLGTLALRAFRRRAR